MLPHTDTATRSVGTIEIRRRDRLARKYLAIRIGIDIQSVEVQRPTTPRDSHVVADRRERDAVVVHLGPKPDVLAFAGVIGGLVGSEPAVVGAFVERGGGFVCGDCFGEDVGEVSGEGEGSVESACAQEEDGRKLHFFFGLV